MYYILVYLFQAYRACCQTMKTTGYRANALYQRPTEPCKIKIPNPFSLLFTITGFKNALNILLQNHNTTWHGQRNA